MLYNFPISQTEFTVTSISHNYKLILHKGPRDTTDCIVGCVLYASIQCTIVSDLCAVALHSVSTSVKEGCLCVDCVVILRRCSLELNRN